MPTFLHVTLVILAANVVIFPAFDLIGAESAKTITNGHLEEKLSVGDISRVQSILEVSGQLKVNADGKQVIRVPVSGKGELQYLERILSTGDTTTPRRSMRYYQSTSATSRIGDKDVTSQLTDEHRLIAAQAAPSEVTVFSPLGPLTHDELELVDIQANTLLLGRLLPAKDTAVGDKWKHDDGLVAALFKLDVVTENNLETVFQRQEANAAHLEMTGKVQGSVGGIGTQIEVTAKYQFDMDSRRISWLAMSIKEDRAVGHAEPGFEITARLRLSISKADAIPELSDKATEQLPQEANSGTTLLSFNSEIGGIRFFHGRDWRVMVDRNDVIILRLIQRGDLIAQCNISRLPDAAPDKQLSMSSFQTDIRRVLDKSFGQIVESAESKNEHELRALRTVVSGVTAELPIQWNYYHLTDSKGRQASLVFTMDAKLLERFAAADQTIISSLELFPKTEEPAKPAAKTATAPSARRATLHMRSE